MIAASELVQQRKMSRAFIIADSFQVVLERSVWTDDGAGGSIKGDPAPLSAQRARLIPLGDGATQRTTLNGESVIPSYMLMGEWDFDVERWDTFLKGGREYEVVFINDNQQYEVKAEVAYRGERV